jgi:hypothetical protein
MSGVEGMKGWGGKREGSGRKPKEPTKTLSYRIPLKHSEGLDLAIRKAIAAYLKKHGKAQ